MTAMNRIFFLIRSLAFFNGPRKTVAPEAIIFFHKQYNCNNFLRDIYAMLPAVPAGKNKRAMTDVSVHDPLSVTAGRTSEDPSAAAVGR